MSANEMVSKGWKCALKTSVFPFFKPLVGGQHFKEKTSQKKKTPTHHSDELQQGHSSISISLTYEILIELYSNKLNFKNWNDTLDFLE